MELEDVGKEVKIRLEPQYSKSNDRLVRVIMGIKAPKGECFIFGTNTDDQVESIKAFMEEHISD